MNAELGGRLVHDPLAIADEIAIAAGHEDETDGEIGVLHELAAQLFDLATEELMGNLREDAGAVTGLCVRVQGPAMGQIAECLDGVFEDAMFLRPSMLATKPTPQASCSNFGS
jgi:hypothetical protein